MRHRDLRLSASEAGPEGIGDLPGFTAHTTDIGRLTELGSHRCRDWCQGVVGQDDVDRRRSSHSLDQVRTGPVVDAARVDHRHP